MGRRAIVLLVALVLAGLAAWAVWNFLQNYQNEAREGQVAVDVFRAGGNGIAEGTEGSIVLSNLGGADAQAIASSDEQEDVPADAITTEEELRRVLTNAIAAGPISANAILTQSQWTTISVDVVPLAEQISSGNQAITISTSNIQGVNGFVEAGDRINMIITIDIEFDLIPLEGIPTLPQPEPPPTTDGTTPAAEQAVTVSYTRYVLQGLNVLAAGREVRPEEDGDQTGEVTAGDATTTGDGTTTETVPPAEGEDQGNSTVFTLEVTPDQAERIVYAFDHGSIWLTLVPEDFVEIETDGVTIDNLFGGDLVDAIFPQG